MLDIGIGGGNIMTGPTRIIILAERKGHCRRNKEETERRDSIVYRDRRRIGRIIARMIEG